MNIIFLVGRVLFGGYFFLMGLNHLTKSASLVGYAASKGVPAPKAAVFFSGLLILVGGLSVILGYMPTYGLAAIALFLVPVTFAMHQFWKVADPMMKMGERVNFMKNMALLGAALALTAVSLPWALSL